MLPLPYWSHLPAIGTAINQLFDRKAPARQKSGQHVLHPLFSTLIQRPDLLAEHVAAYSALFHEEVSQASSALLTRYVAWTAAAVFGVMFVLFAGFALMMGALHNQFHWMLLAVPGGALALMVIAIVKAKAALIPARFTGLKAQIDSDIRALRVQS